MANHYLDNKKFETTIREYLDGSSCLENELVEMFDLLITNVINSFNFRVDTDDAKQDCFLLIFSKLPNFKNKKGTAFNYFTTMIVNHLKFLYTKNKKYRLKIENYILRAKESGDFHIS